MTVGIVCGGGGGLYGLVDEGFVEKRGPVNERALGSCPSKKILHGSHRTIY